MKLICLFIVAFFTMTFLIRAQNNEFLVGAVIGFYGIENKGDIKSMYSQSNGTISGTGGFSFGLNVKHDFSKNIYSALELRYIRKGSIYTFITTFGTMSWESIKLNYIEIPLLAGLRINLKKKPLFVETGIAYAMVLSSKVLVSELNFWDSSAEQNNFKKKDISWVANVKYPIIKSRKLLMGLRFSYSMFSIHSFCKLYNMDYGAELYYLFNRNVK
jgi:hypothetical protein